MNIIIMTFGFFTAASFVDLSRDQSSKNFRYILFCFLTLWLIILAGLRSYKTGMDGGNYLAFFNTVPDVWVLITEGMSRLGGGEVFEPGYTILNSIVKAITNHYAAIFFLVAFLGVGINAYNYKKKSSYVILSLLLYFVHTYLYREFGQIRAGVACAIGLFTVSQIYYREHKRVLLTIGIATMFHFAALSLFLPYFLSFFKITRKRLVLVGIIGILLGSVGVSDFLVSILPDKFIIIEKIVQYSQSEKYARDLGLLNITNIKNYAVLFSFLIFWRKLKNKVPYFKIMMLFLALNAAWRVAFSDFAILAGRIATFYSIVEVILIPYMITIFRQKFIIWLLIILYAGLMLFLNLYHQDLNTLPYNFSVG